MVDIWYVSAILFSWIVVIWISFLKEITQASAQTATQANTFPLKKALEIGGTFEAFLYAFSLIVYTIQVVINRIGQGQGKVNPLNMCELQLGQDSIQI